MEIISVTLMAAGFGPLCSCFMGRILTEGSDPAGLKRGYKQGLNQLQDLVHRYCSIFFSPGYLCS